MTESEEVVILWAAWNILTTGKILTGGETLNELSDRSRIGIINDTVDLERWTEKFNEAKTNYN